VRRVGTDEVVEFEVSGERIQAVHMLPGYTHSIADPSDTEDLVTVMWANEVFDPSRPDTFFEPV
jgi:UDP-2-acetamido-2,6-beta-L-arabino-hexul-4-ose reductase